MSSSRCGVVGWRAGAGALLLALAAAAAAQQSSVPCGEVIGVATSQGTTTSYSLARPEGTSAATLVLLPGGGGSLRLDQAGCARGLRGNSLVRSRALFAAEGFATALVDARSDHTGEDGLGGLRGMPEHAEDLGKVIADLRTRVPGPVWLVGTSRGAISAANGAARSTGAGAADGVIITSPVSVGSASKIRPWVAQTVFDLPLRSIRLPMLIVGHAADACLRSPANQIDAILARTQSARGQTAVVGGGPGPAGSSIAECEGMSAHGFLGQEAEVAAGMARFIRGARY